MPALSQHVNVGATARAVLEAKGFQVWRDAKLTSTALKETDGISSPTICPAC